MSNETSGSPTGADKSSQDEPKPGEQPPQNAPEPKDEPDTFPRKYVEELREESKQHRLRAQRADALAQQLFESRVRLLGRLEDPTDLPFDEALLEDDDALTAAVDDLLARKPHLAARTVAGRIGAGESGSTDGEVSLVGMLRDRA